jgi:DNA polymerase delta subunit 1
MSPIKRRSEEEGQPLISPKRLRGGAGFEDEAFVDEQELFDDSLIVVPNEEEQIPDEIINNLLPQDLSDTMKSKWSRPPVALKGNDEDLSFQWLDIDVIGGKPLPQNPNMNKDKVVGATSGQVPVLRVYGVTHEGNSVAAFLHGFTPYAYFALPPNATFDPTESNLAHIRDVLNTKLQAMSRGMDKGMNMVHGVKYVDNFKSIMGYESPHTRFFKIHVAMPTLIPTLKRIMEQGLCLPGMEGGYDQEFAPFECNVPYVLRYMIDSDVGGAGWLTLPAKMFQIRRGAKQTYCQVSSFLLCVELVVCFV